MSTEPRKTENSTHPWERSGLGEAPYTYLGMTEHTYQSCPGAPIQAGGTCDYCANGIRYEFAVRSSDGKTFVVGSSCISAVGREAKILSDSERDLRKHKLEHWNRNKESNRAWLGLNMMTEGRAGFRAFNEGNREVGREVDFVLLRQLLAKGWSWGAELTEKIMPWNAKK